jgi:hypothetical protein
VGSRSGLDAVAKRKKPYSCRKSNPGRLAPSLVIIKAEILSKLLSILYRVANRFTVLSDVM